jgi:hypothetical protein
VVTDENGRARDAHRPQRKWLRNLRRFIDDADVKRSASKEGMLYAETGHADDLGVLQVGVQVAQGGKLAAGIHSLEAIRREILSTDRGCATNDTQYIDFRVDALQQDIIDGIVRMRRDEY